MDYGTLVYAQRGGVVQRFALRPGTITLGRATTNDLQLDDPSVAAQHVRLFCRADGCWVSDLGSPEGTTLNLARLQPNLRQLLRDGDIVQVGPFFVRYVAGQPAASGETPGPRMLPPEVAARAQPPTAMQSRFAGARRLRGNSRPPATLPPSGEVSSYLQYLPPRYQEMAFMGRFLLIFESILGPLERMIDDLDLYFDPLVAPEAMLPWLATWLGLTLDGHLTVAQQRALLRAAAQLYKLRGTLSGMSEVVQLCTGVVPEIIEPGSPQSTLPPHVFKVIVRVAEPDKLDRPLLERMIALQKPAHTSYILEVLEARG